MNSLLQHLKNPKNKLSLILLVSVVLFMQCYLLQHKVDHQDHHHADHGTHEVVQECQLCLGAQQASQLILPSIHHLSLSLIGIFILVLSYCAIVFSPVFLLPQTRAPPVFNF